MATLAQKFRSFPPQIKFIIGNEMCERFSYYGMRNILVIYLVKNLAMARKDSIAIFHIFAGGGYLCTLLGGYLGDRVLGRYRTILYLSLLYCVGHACIALWETRTGLYCGLTLIALGMGAVKACVSTYVGDQFTEKNKSMVKDVFDVFYWSINLGATFAAISIPLVLFWVGPSWAFGIPGILMGLSTLIFWLGRKQYLRAPLARETGDAGFMPVFFYALCHQSRRKPGQKFFDVALEKFPASDVEGAHAVAQIANVFAMIIVLSAVLDQQASTWILQADQMNLNVLGFNLQAAQIRALNPIMVMALIPIYMVWIYPGIERCGIKLTPLRKMGGGMALAALSSIPIGFIQMALDSGHKISVAWQVIPLLIAAMSEVMVAITGLEFAYSQAPRSMKGTIMSFWFLTIFMGNWLTALIAELNIFHGAFYYFFFAVVMAVATVIFAVIASRYQVHDYYEKEKRLLTDDPGLEPASA